MMVKRYRSQRRGAIIPLLALTVIPMFAFLALAIDIGVLAVTKNQCQNAADAASLAGARSLDGSATQNQTNAVANANTVADLNFVLGKTVLAQEPGPVPKAQVTVAFGSYHYGPPAGNPNGTPYFYPIIPTQQNPATATAPDNLNLCQVTVTYTGTYGFAGILSFFAGGNTSQYSVGASAIAAHRPRDVAITLDFSGSMNNESDLWNCESYLNDSTTRTGTSNNQESVFPLFGHYSNSQNYSQNTTYANLLSPAAPGSGSAMSGSTVIGCSNMTIPYQGTPALVNDFYQNAHGAGAVGAFTAQPDSYATTPGGDQYVGMGGVATTVGPYAATVQDITGGTARNATWETQGYAGFGAQVALKGYTVGPRYWGKTFFIWPPDPTNDWRGKYFFKSDGVTPLNDNTLLFQNGGTQNGNDGYNGFKNPVGNYVINYKAILAWIKNTTGAGNINPFPTQLRSGNVLFYSAIPTDVPASAYNHSNPNIQITDPDQRFWKEYIDFCLGVWRDPESNVQHPGNSSLSYGPEFQFGGQNNRAYAVTVPPVVIPSQYMSYTDNPMRPRHRLWFGPMTMIQYMMDSGNSSGAMHDISMFPMKQGIASALGDIQNNHPNNMVAICAWNRPVYNNDPAGDGFMNSALYDLNNDYPSMINSIWVPAGSQSADVRLWDAAGLPNNYIPRAHGDWDGNTSSQYGLMMAYNQFSQASALQNNPTGSGGFGRRGAGKIVVFETDGMYNVKANPSSSFVNAGVNQSYYPIRYKVDTVNQAGTGSGDCATVTQAIVNMANGTAPTDPRFTPYTPNPGFPGYSTSANPAFVYVIAFGVVFDANLSSGTKSSAIGICQEIAQAGGTVFPSSASDPTWGWTWCTGTLADRQAKIKQAVLNIFDADVPVSLIK